MLSPPKGGGLKLNTDLLLDQETQWLVLEQAEAYTHRSIVLHQDDQRKRQSLGLGDVISALSS